MTGGRAGRGTTTDDAARAAARWYPGRLFRRAAEPDRANRRAGVEPFPALLVTPRVWVALG